MFQQRVPPMDLFMEEMKLRLALRLRFQNLVDTIESDLGHLSIICKGIAKFVLLDAVKNSIATLSQTLPRTY